MELSSVDTDPPQAQGKLFAIPALGKYTVFVSTSEQVEEVFRAPIMQLSFNAAIDEVRRNDEEGMHPEAMISHICSNSCLFLHSMASASTRKILDMPYLYTL